MQTRTFYGLLENAWKESGSMVCVGLDPDYKLLPVCIRSKYRKEQLDEALIVFCTSIINSTRQYACAYKMNLGSFRRYGDLGSRALQRIIDHIRIHAGHCVVILDAKYGDEQNTNGWYAEEAFDVYKVDAVTVNPYMGGAATFKPFLERSDKGVIVLCKSSNNDGPLFQNLKCSRKRELYMHVAYQVKKWNAQYQNCGLVVGATFPKELKRIRKVVGDMPILAPGVGRQGGDAYITALDGSTKKRTGLIISNSSQIMYASSGQDYPEASGEIAMQMHTSIRSGANLCAKTM